jgi:hypothetical protein
MVTRSVLLGDVVTTARTGNMSVANARLDHALKAACKILRLDAGRNLEQRGASTVVIPRVLAISHWTPPAATKLRQLRTKMIETVIGRNRRMRCPEIVMGVICNPVRHDPWGAILAHTLLKTRRMWDKDKSRLKKFLEMTAHYILNKDTKSHATAGPVSAFASALFELGVQGNVNLKDQSLILKNDNGPEINFATAPLGVIKEEVGRWVRQAALRRLKEDGDKPTPRRKDMCGIGECVDQVATLSLMRMKKSPIQHLTVKHCCQINLALMTGSVRAGDRLHAAGLLSTDVCAADAERETTLHVLRHCPKFANIRKPYLQKIEATLMVAKKYGKEVYQRVAEVAECNAFQHTGVVNADPKAVR